MTATLIEANHASERASDDPAMDRHEATRIARERYGLDPEGVDHNLLRIIRLAKHSLGATAAAFAIPIRGGSTSYVITEGFKLGGDPRTTVGCNRVMAEGRPIIETAVDGSFMNGCTALNGIQVRQFVGLPVLSEEKRTIGVMSLMFDHDLRVHDDELAILNDYVRLIEDSFLLRALNVRDPLTNLFNRRFLDHQIDHEWRRALRMQLPLSIAIKDIDHFKQFNDTAGHLEGDLVLKAVADLAQKSFSRAGDFVCRFGGEEFAVVMPSTPPKAAMTQAERFRTALESMAIPHPAFDSRAVTVSVGVTTITSLNSLERTSVDEAIKQADKALYAAKANGRNRSEHYYSIV